MWSSNDNLVNHYQTNFNLMNIHHFNLNDLYNMIPYERDIYVALLLKRMEELEKGKQ